MQHLTFDPAAINYAKRIQAGKAPLSTTRLIVVGKSGARHDFLLYTFAPFFEPQPRHLFTSCGRFVVMRHRYQAADEKMYAMPQQFFTFYRGTLVPENRVAYRFNVRDTQGRVASRYQRTAGKYTGEVAGA